MVLRKLFLIGAIIFIIAGPFISYTTTFQGVELIEEEFTSFDGTKLTGTVIKPLGHKGTDRAPLIVLMHGFTASKEFFYLIGSELARHGYVCFSFNARGHQTSGNESSLALYEIQDFQEAITYMLSKSTTYGINDTQVGIIGHSHGAMCATIVGALDPRVNATIPISTGANASDVIAKFLGLDLPSVYNRVKDIMNFGIDFTDPAEAAIRSPINYVNESYPSNLLLINGDLDEGFSIRENQEILAKAIWNDTGRADEVVPGKLYTNSSGLRRLVVEENVEHIMEAFMPETLNETVKWMDLTFYGGLRAPVNTDVVYFMISGIMLTYLGGILGFFALTSYLNKWLNKKGAQTPKETQNISSTDKTFQFAMYFALISGISALVPLIVFNIPELHSWIPILITDLIGVICTFFALLTIPVLIFLLWYEKKKFGTTLADYGLGIHGMGSSAIIGILGGLFFVAILSLAVSDFLLKIIPADIGNFFIVFLTFLPYVFVMELWGRGFIQTKFRNRGKFTEILGSAIIVGILQGLGMFVIFFVNQFVIGMPASITLNENLPAISIPLFFMVLYGVLYFGLSLLGGFIFHKTRNVLGSTLAITIIISWLLTAWPPRFI